MRGPKPPAIALSDVERQELDALTRRHTTPQQLALRARIVLAAADGANNGQIARQLHVSVNMVRRWRERWLVLHPAALEDLPVLERFTDETPTGADRPMSQWTSRDLADEVKQRGIVEQISGRHAARLLKRGRSNRTASAIG
jgi:putative transposase